jgi:putative spermidine/putrescine transport system permease protein
VMVGQLIQRNVELFSSWGAASAVSVVLLAIVLLLFWVMNRLVPLDHVFRG